MDKLTSIRVFLQVARMGSFSAAAQQLRISKAMASKHVSSLERQLGVRLFNRTTRHLSLTDTGLNYRDRVQGIMEALEETELSTARLSSEPTGTLRIMAPTSFGSFHLTRAVAEYRQIYPRISVDLIFASHTPDFIGEGLDLAIQTGELKDSNLVARKLTQSRQVVCGAPDYLARHGSPERPADLERHNCLLFTPRSPAGVWTFSGPEGVYAQRVHGDVSANTGDALRIAAIQGCGLIQLPTYILGLDIKAGRLKVLLEQFEPPARPIYAIYLHRAYLSAKVSTFVEFLYQLYQPVPYWEHWTGE